jgi:hypothetical protein
MKTMTKTIILVGACVSLLAGCCTAPVAPTNWEYQIVDDQLFVGLMNAINQRAKDGWELMSVHPPPPNSTSAYAVMRRPKK